MGKAPKRATGSTTAHTAFVDKCKLAVELFYAHKFESISVAHEKISLSFIVSKESQVIKTIPKVTVEGVSFIKSDRVTYALQPSGNVIMSMMVANLNKLPQLIDTLLKEKVAFELLH